MGSAPIVDLYAWGAFNSKPAADLRASPSSRTSIPGKSIGSRDAETAACVSADASAVRQGETRMSAHQSPLIKKLDRLTSFSDREKDILETICSDIVQIGTDHDIISEGQRPSDSNLLLEGFVCRY